MLAEILPMVFCRAHYYVFTMNFALYKWARIIYVRLNSSSREFVPGRAKNALKTSFLPDEGIFSNFIFIYHIFLIHEFVVAIPHAFCAREVANVNICVDHIGQRASRNRRTADEAGDKSRHRGASREGSFGRKACVGKGEKL